MQYLYCTVEIDLLNETKENMNWNQIAEFNFTYAMPGGAWLKDAAGQMEWCSFSQITQKLGEIWLNRQMKKQGWMTGCWITIAN